MKEKVDVLVVGGGPAGLSTAHSFGPAGKTLLVHKDHSIGLPVRTSGGSWLRDIDALGIPSEYYHQIRQLSFAAPSGTATVTFPDDRPVVLDVTGAYRYLAELAWGKGVLVQCRTAFEKVTDISDDNVTCLIFDGKCRREVSARFVVDASGYRRSVLSSIGASRAPDRVGVGIEYEFEDQSNSHDKAILFVGHQYAPSGYGWIFPTRARTVRVGVCLIKPDTAASPRKTLDSFISSGAMQSFGIRTGALLARHAGIIPSDGPSSRFLYGRILAVGDSVSHALPLVGEGIRYSIEAGRRAGSALAAAVNDEANYAAHLNAYARWWDNTYRRSFTLAQKANVKMSSFTDRHWNEVLSAFRLLSGNEVAALLRAEFDLPGVSRLLITHGRHAIPSLLRRPSRLLRYGLRAWCLPLR